MSLKKVILVVPIELEEKDDTFKFRRQIWKGPTVIVSFSEEEQKNERTKNKRVSRIPDGNTASISPRSDRLFLKVDDHFPKWAMDGILLDFDEPGGLFSKNLGLTRLFLEINAHF